MNKPNDKSTERTELLSDESMQHVVERIGEKTGGAEDDRIADAIVLAHQHHYGPCPKCGSELKLVRLPDKHRESGVDYQGIELRKGLMRCDCGEQGLVLNEDGGLKP